MMVRIKVNREEFNQAESDGAVWGQYLYRKPKLFVYSELGKERDYIPTDKDDPRADYRLFINCYVEYYRTMEDLNSGNTIADGMENDVTVIIYC